MFDAFSSELVPRPFLYPELELHFLRNKWNTPSAFRIFSARVAVLSRKILPGVCAADSGWTVDIIAVVRGVGRVRPRHFADDDDASLAARRRRPGARVSVERVRSPGESTERIK